MKETVMKNAVGGRGSDYVDYRTAEAIDRWVKQFSRPDMQAAIQKQLGGTYTPYKIEYTNPPPLAPRGTRFEGGVTTLSKPKDVTQGNIFKGSLTPEGKFQTGVNYGSTGRPRILHERPVGGNMILRRFK